MDHALSFVTNDLEFQDFCVKFLRYFWVDSDPEPFGSPGQSQYGVDIVDVSGLLPLRGAQCKFKQAGRHLGPEEVRHEVELARQFDFNGDPLGTFLLLTTSNRRTQVQSEVFSLNKEHKAIKLFPIKVLYHDDLIRLLKKYPSLVSELLDGICPPNASLLHEFANDLTATIRTSMDAIAGPLSSVVSDFDQRLDLAKQRLDDNDRASARQILTVLREKDWSRLSEQHRFLTLTYLAKAAVDDDRWEEGAKFFLEAEQYDQTSERAKTNGILALELLGRRDEAYAGSGELLKDYPESTRLWAIRCRSAPESISSSDLEQNLPVVCTADDEVSVALANRHLRTGNWDEVIRLCSGAARTNTKWVPPLLTLGQAKIQKAYEASYKPDEGPIAVADSRLIHEAIDDLEKAIDIADRNGLSYLLSCSLIDRARARRLLGEERKAAEDFAAAYHRSPNHDHVLQRYGEYLFAKGELNAAIPILRQAVRQSHDPDATFVLALALFQQDETKNRSEWTSFAFEAACQPNWLHRGQAIGFALPELLRTPDDPRLVQLLDSLATDPDKDSVSAVIAARKSLSLKDRETANGHLEEAIQSLTVGSTTDTLRLVADLLERVQDYERSLPIWLKICSRTKLLPDALHAATVASWARRSDVVADIGREWRQNGIYDDKLLDLEIAAIERHQPKEALRIVDDALQSRPDDWALILRRSFLAIRLGKPELVCTDLDVLPKPSVSDVEIGRLVVHVLRQSGKVNEAFKYAYKLLRHHWASHLAHGTLLSFFGEADELESLLAAPETVVPGSAVKLIEDEQQNQQWILIEDDPEGIRVELERDADDGLVKLLLGHKVGERIWVHGDLYAGRHVTIVDIQSKYLFRLRDIMSNWELRFPEYFLVEQMRFDPPENDSSIPDLTPMIRQLHEQKRSIESILDAYATSPLSIYSVAEKLGRGVIDCVEALAWHDKSTIRCTPADARELQRVSKAINRQTRIVLDLTAIASIVLLDLSDDICRSGVRFVMSPATHHQMSRYEASVVDRPGEARMYAVSGGVGVRFEETDAEAHQQRARFVSETLRRIRAVSTVEDCPGVMQLGVAESDQLKSIFGDAGLESIILARDNASILWTDGFPLAVVARDKYGCQNTWTQAILQGFRELGVLSEEELNQFAAKLLGFGYDATFYNYATLLSACELSNWNPDAPLLTRSLRSLASSMNPRANIAIASRLIVSIISLPIALPRHGEVIVTVLRMISEGPTHIEGVRKISRSVSRLFGTDAMRAEAAAKVIDQWLKLHDTCESLSDGIVIP